MFFFLLKDKKLLKVFFFKKKISFEFKGFVCFLIRIWFYVLMKLYFL